MMDEQPRPHVPMTEEERGNTWEYCYGQPVIIPPLQPMEPDHEHHQ